MMASDAIEPRGQPYTNSVLLLWRGSKDQLISCGRASTETLQQARLGQTDQGVLHGSAHQPRFRYQISHLEAAFRR